MRSTTTYYVIFMTQNTTRKLDSDVALIPRRNFERWKAAPAAEASVSAIPAPVNDAIAGTECEIRFVNSARTVIAESDESVLEAGLREDVDLAFSCTLGGCGTCRVKLLSGRVDMIEDNCLSEEEIAEGWILACSSKPLTALEIEA